MRERERERERGRRTVFIFTLKAEARDYGKGRYISDACQLVNQSSLCLSEGGAL